MEMALVNIKPFNSILGGIIMANVFNTINTNPQAQVIGAIPGTTVEDQTKARERFFEIYPEIGYLYKEFGDPITTLRSDWFEIEKLKDMGKFVGVIKKLEITELFPNYEALEKVASLTDAGTISSTLIAAMNTLCTKSFQILSSDNELFQSKGYRDMARWIINRDLVSEVENEGLLYKAFKLFEIDPKDVIDFIEVEKLLASYEIKVED